MSTKTIKALERAAKAIDKALTLAKGDGAPKRTRAAAAKRGKRVVSKTITRRAKASRKAVAAPKSAKRAKKVAA